jgi:hypothetical protein
LPIRFGYQNCLAVMDRNLMRTNLDLEGHAVFPCRRSCRRAFDSGAVLPKSRPTGFVVSQFLGSEFSKRSTRRMPESNKPRVSVCKPILTTRRRANTPEKATACYEIKGTTSAYERFPLTQNRKLCASESEILKPGQNQSLYKQRPWRPKHRVSVRTIADKLRAVAGEVIEWASISSVFGL